MRFVDELSTVSVLWSHVNSCYVLSSQVKLGCRHLSYICMLTLLMYHNVVTTSVATVFI